MVYAEAFAAGTPVVASTKTPWQDVEKYNCGKWVENTPEKFAKAINEILSFRCNQMGRTGVSMWKKTSVGRRLAKNSKNKLKII